MTERKEDSQGCPDDRSIVVFKENLRILVVVRRGPRTEVCRTFEAKAFYYYACLYPDNIHKDEICKYLTSKSTGNPLAAQK